MVVSLFPVSTQPSSGTAPLYDSFPPVLPCRYDIFLFARPDTLLAWASLPVVKVMQIR